MGLGLLYESFGGKCGSTDFMGLFKVLRDFPAIMKESHDLIKVVKGKVTFLIKTTDLLNSKLIQVINFMRLMAGAFTGWQSVRMPISRKNFVILILTRILFSLFYGGKQSAHGIITP